eukprot:730520_1
MMNENKSHQHLHGIYFTLKRPMIMRSRDKDYLASVASIWNLYRSAYDFIVVCDDIDMVSHPVQFPNISRLYIAITREHRNVIAIQHITIESTRPKKEEPPTQGSFQETAVMEIL